MSQIFENQLNLALETPEAEREQTQDLNVGFSTEENTWELIVKYHDTLERLRTGGIGVEYLIAGYAILTVSESRVEELTSYPEIEYVEKPKRYYYSRVRPTDVSCIPQVMFREPFLTGEGVLIAVLDSGIAYRREVFRNADGSSRILELWDQTLQPDSRTEEQQDEDDSDNIADTVRAIREPPRGFAQGVLFDRDIINAALRLDAYEGNLLVPSTDVSGHGTAVAGIAAASASDGYSGVANRSDLLIVKLGTPNEGGFPRTTEIMRGVTYAVNKALELAKPLVINLSFGNTYGAHDGSSLLERFLDNASEIGKTVICVGSGNEASTNGHFEGVISERRMAELAVGSYERSLSVQLWKDYADDFLLQMRSPGGEEATLSPAVEAGKYTLSLEGTKILVYFGEPTPYSAAQEIYLEFLPQEAGNTGTVSTGSGNAGFLTEGIWRFTLVPINIVNGRYSFYLPGAATRNERTGFFDASPEATFTIPSTAGKVLTVGAYDSYFESYAPFSGRGYGDLSDREAVTQIGLTKPDIAAPGVNIMAPDVYGGWISVSGTSFATPIVSGVCALMMQWGIIEKRDEFLYGEKLKAYLRRGARPIRGERAYPNSKVGYGGICIFDSLL